MGAVGSEGAEPAVSIRFRKALLYIRAMMPVLRFIQPCLPSPADRPPSESSWIHEIKHDGDRLMARRDPVGIRLITRRGNDWSDRFPLVIEAVNCQGPLVSDRRRVGVL